MTAITGASTTTPTAVTLKVVDGLITLDLGPLVIDLSGQEAIQLASGLIQSARRPDVRSTR